MYTTADGPPTIVVVGNYGVGKSSFVRAFSGDSQTPQTQSKEPGSDLGHLPTKGGHLSNSSQESEFEVAESELVMEARVITINDAKGHDHTVRVVDTAARDVTGTQQQMQNADLVIVIMNASSSKSIDDLDEYWIGQFEDISLYSPVMACFNQIDRLSAEALSELKHKFATPIKERFVLEDFVYVSAHSFMGISECRQKAIHILQSVRERPRWVLIDPFTWKLQPVFECALRRIFRLLDDDGDCMLNLNELAYFNTEVLTDKFTAKDYSILLRKLNATSEQFVTPQGLTFEGFRYLMRRFAIARNLHNRVFPQLPDKEPDQTLELSKYVYVLLEKLFYQFADDTLLDDHDTKSIASSMISSQQNPMLHQYHQQHHRHHRASDEDSMENPDSDPMSEEDEGKVLSTEAIRSILAVLPPSLRCTLADRHVMDHFETAGRKLNKLTKNGWLSFWAMLAVENPFLCSRQLTYLDLDADTDRSAWFKLTDRKLLDHEREKISRSVIRVLLFGGPQCGKTVFCDRLLCRIPIARTKSRHGGMVQHRPTKHFRAVSNRVGLRDEYNFLAITEVPAMNQCIEEAMDHFLSAYDMILLMFDQSQSRSFYELNKIFDRMPKDHQLPIQVLATKSDLRPVTQYNLEPDSGGRSGHGPYTERAMSSTSSLHSPQHLGSRSNGGSNVVYAVPQALSSMGLHSYAPTHLTHDDSSDFPQLFDDIFFIATNPHFRRLKKNRDSPQQDRFPWKTIIKRTVTITVGVSVVLLSAYKIYKLWFQRPNVSRDQHPVSVQRRYRL